jgi:hypothetical protein
MLLSNPRFERHTVTSPVETEQIAPTILSELGLDPGKLDAVQLEGTQVLPGLSPGPDGRQLTFRTGAQNKINTAIKKGGAKPESAPPFVFEGMDCAERACCHVSVYSAAAALREGKNARRLAIIEWAVVLYE